MATVAEAVGNDLSGYGPMAQVGVGGVAPPVTDLAPGRSPTVRCPLPPVFQPSPDSLRNFYMKGQVPQTRIFNPSLSAANVGGASGGSGTVIETSSGGSSGPVGPTQLSSSTVTLTTPVLGPGQSFAGSMTVSESFQMLSVSASNAARFELYGTAAAQMGDSYRALDVPPPAGTAQNLICDVAMDTAPFQWAFQNRAGANADSPQRATVYTTVTNLSMASTAVTVTMLYVGLE
jgi:hypothetical protein